MGNKNHLPEKASYLFLGLIAAVTIFLILNTARLYTQIDQMEERIEQNNREYRAVVENFEKLKAQDHIIDLTEFEESQREILFNMAEELREDN